jgi:integral membrane protein
MLQRGGGSSAALLRYRVMAYVVGTGLVILVCIAVPLKYAAGEPLLAAVVGTLHGFLFIVYLLATLDLGLRWRLPLWLIVAVMAAGTVPFASFAAERYVSARLRPIQNRSGGR